LHEYGYLKDVKVDILARDVITETVPSLEQVPIEAILKFREKRAEELENFRIEMRKLVIEIESSPWDADFLRRVSDIIDLRVKPTLKEIENQIHGCKDRFWVKAVRNVATIGPLLLIGGIFAGVPPHVAVALGGTFSALALILERWSDMRNIKRNGWAFFNRC
jgi:hypothetical protein